MVKVCVLQCGERMFSAEGRLNFILKIGCT